MRYILPANYRLEKIKDSNLFKDMADVGAARGGGKSDYTREFRLLSVNFCQIIV